MRQVKGHGSKFGRKKEEAIVALLTQRNLEEAAKSIGVAPNTLLKWQKLPEFDAAYRDARKGAYRQAVARLQQGAEPFHGDRRRVDAKQRSDQQEPISTLAAIGAIHVTHGRAQSVGDCDPTSRWQARENRGNCMASASCRRQHSA
jgi:hypothetical protein